MHDVWRFSKGTTKLWIVLLHLSSVVCTTGVCVVCTTGVSDMIVAGLFFFNEIFFQYS